MEILQTIWTALTTENELLIKVTSMPMLILELYVSMLLFTTILNISTNKKQKFLYICILSLIGILNLWVIPTPYNTFINIIACPLLIYFLFKTSFLKSILAEIIPYIFFVIISTLLITFCVKITKMPSNNFLQIPLYKLCFSLVMYSITYLFYLACNKFNLNINLLDKMKRTISFRIFINFIIRINSYSFAILYIYNLY